MLILNRLCPSLRCIIGLAAIVLVLSSCSNMKTYSVTYMKTYSVTYKNVSTEKITQARGLWGEYLLGIGQSSGHNGNPKKGGMTNIFFQYPIPAQAGALWTNPIPAQAGALWTNAAGERVRVEVPLDKHQFPRLNKDEDYEFVFELRQTDIRQVELVVHGKTRSKKRKVMLYCAATENDGCEFNTPFTTDTFYDSPAQEAKAKAIKAQFAAAGAKAAEKAKAEAKARLKRNNYTTNP